MSGYIEDRWLKKRPNNKTGKRERTAIYGKCTRYRVKGIVGVKGRSFAVLQDAKAWLAHAQTDVRRGEFTDPRDGAINVKEYIESHWWPTRSGDPGTLERIEQRLRGHIIPHLGPLPLNSVGPEALRGWMKRLERDLGPPSIRLIWGTLSGVLQAAVEECRIARNPCRSHSSVKPPSAPAGRLEAWPRERVLTVREALPERYRVLIEIGAGLGLRQGEAFGLSLEDIDFTHEVIRVRRQVKIIGTRQCFAISKSKKLREVPLPSSVAVALRQHVDSWAPIGVTLPWGDPRPPETPAEGKYRKPKTCKLLVVTPQGAALNRNHFNSGVWKPALSDAGVIGEPKVVKGRRVWDQSREHGYHALRHFYASEQLEAGESIVSLAQWLGHSDPAFTLRKYAHFLPRAGAYGKAAIDTIFV
ncbi:tyrosine-type recombinase/integrase [Streptomyces sp. NPDC058000]|uniref:tyrosine-type recombinase/integrase n=1 Tax=Streptomyces sp. NPDC058000 TaxID=3346299 RepID=UPI0036E93119